MNVQEPEIWILFTSIQRNRLILKSILFNKLLIDMYITLYLDIAFKSGRLDVKLGTNHGAYNFTPMFL